VPFTAPEPSRPDAPDHARDHALAVPPRPRLADRARLDPVDLLERLRTRWEDPRVRAGVLLVVAAVAGLVWFRLGQSSGGGGGAAPVGAPAAAAPRVTTTTTEAAGELVVHVAGAVARPGVVRVRAGARVVDAIDAAGGGLPDAALDRLNLAATLVDGQRVAVSRVGEPAPPVDSGAAGGAGAGVVTGGTGEAGAASGPLDLNAATQAQLEELPGIGPALAGAILRYRDEHGGFRSVGELREVRGIGEARFADLEGLVTV
jgi:competence protein ComEA